MMAILYLTLFLILPCLSACNVALPLNRNTPEYVKTVAAYKEGSDGLVVYFVLAR